MIVLNLLPPIEKKALKLDYARRAVIFYGILILFLLGVFVIFLFPSYLTLKLQLDSLEGQINFEKATVESRQVLGLEARLGEVNKNIVALSEFSKKSAALSPLLESLAKVLPSGAYFTEVSFQKSPAVQPGGPARTTDNVQPGGQAEAGKITLRGFAKTRADVLAIKYNLEIGEYFTEIESPVLNYLKESDINFVFFAKIKIAKASL